MEICGISDISSSEGKLWRFTNICHIVNSLDNPSKNEVINSVKALIGLSNQNVIERHLSILKRLNIIEYIETKYVLTGIGKALIELSKSSKNESTKEEKIFYFTLMFSSVLKEQLIDVLRAVYENEFQSRREIIAYYFDRNIARAVWGNEIVDKNLNKLRSTNKIPSFMGNKFGCMEMWLTDLDIVKRYNGKLKLVEITKSVVRRMLESNDISNKIYELAGVALIGDVMPFDNIKHQYKLESLLRTSYKAFSTHQNLIDYKGIMKVICTRFLVMRIKIEEEDFDRAIKQLWLEGRVRSVMLGRDGKPAYLVFSQPT